MANLIKAASYARVSTLLGQDINIQIHGIKNLAEHRNYQLVKSYEDEGVSGKTEKRPGLDQLVKDARNGCFSILIIHSIDRLGRSTRHLLNLIEEFKHYNISIVSIRENLDFTTPTGQMALTMLSAVAQLEAQLISERIKTSLAVKKAIAEKNSTGWTCGRPRIKQSIEEEVLRLHKEGLSIRMIAENLQSISKSSVARILKQLSKNHV